MKLSVSAILGITSVGFLSYYFYNKFSSKKLSIHIEDEENDTEDIVVMEKTSPKNEPLTPIQKLVHDHFQIAHR